MGGGTPRNTTTTTVTEYPEWLKQPMQENISRANEIATNMENQGYQTYNTADRIAGFNDLQLNALNAASSSVGNWTPMLQSAANQNAQAGSIASQVAGAPLADYSAQAAYAGPSALVQSGSLQGTNLAGYMNPYNQMVTQNALGNLEEARQTQQLNNSDAAAKARAFGGSRHGVVEANTNAAFAKQAGDLALNSAQQNFLNAQQMANQDISRNLQAQGMNQSAWNQMGQFNAGLAQQANLQNAQQGLQGDLAMRGIGLDAAQSLRAGAGVDSTLASQYQGMSANDMNNMFSAGQILQDQDQLNRDFAYQEFLNQRNFPIDLLNLRMGAVTNTPYQPGASMTSPIYRNRGAGFLGGAMAGGQMGSMFTNGSNMGTGIGAVMGGLLGAYG